jgi:tryptophan synthase alpha chain
MTHVIHKAISDARAAGRTAFIPFVTAGFPDESTFADILCTLDESGADVIEVGLPFSDPLADGPIIQSSSKQALDAGITPIRVLELIREVKSRLHAPIVIMSYVNPILRMGFDTFAGRAADAGVSGAIVPDLPPEEADEWIEAAERNGIANVFLVSPTTSPERAATVASKSSGFLYYVSMTGVTGSEFHVSDEMTRAIRQIRDISSIPVAVGFGISTEQHAAALAGIADGVIVGSALIKAIMASTTRDEQISAVRTIAESICRGLDDGNGSADRHAANTN